MTKAYDKAWLEAIIYVMHKQGLNTQEWTLAKMLNENLVAEIKTKYGKTREIHIRDSIRQGGVLSVMQYALLMDEINKEIEANNLGTTIEGVDQKIGCLLWMDDVVLVSGDQQELQKMLNITNEIAGRYHIEFGKEKSKVMKIGRSKKLPKFTLGEMY